MSCSQVPADLGAWFQVLDPAGVVQHEEQRAEFDFARYEPDPHQTFAFAGQARTQILSSDLLASEMVVYPGLRYERTEGGYHVFQLPVQHPGHDAFQGCSGAPILDMERRVVGLVCSGSIPDNTISCRSEEHTSELQSLMRISYAVFCL